LALVREAEITTATLRQPAARSRAAASLPPSALSARIRSAAAPSGGAGRLISTMRAPFCAQSRINASGAAPDSSTTVRTR